MKTATTLALLALLILAVPRARAHLQVQAPTGSSDGELGILQDITFTITDAADAQAFIFDEWVVSDGSRTGSALFPPWISLNHGAPF